MSHDADGALKRAWNPNFDRTDERDIGKSKLTS
jgi:hypothetical protein